MKDQNSLLSMQLRQRLATFNTQPRRRVQPNDHIVLAKGRDSADISPVAGIILGSRAQDVDVKVDVAPRE